MYIFAAKIIHVRTRNRHRTSSRLPRNSSQLPNMEVLSRFRPIITLKELDTALNTAAEWIRINRFPYYAPFQLQRVSGCRAGEAFTPRRWGVNEDWLQVLFSSKGSNERVFTADDTAAIQNYLYRTYDVIERGFTYDNYRRVCRQAMAQAGIFMIDCYGMRYGSSHILRHAFVKKLLWGGMSLEAAQQYMGEKTAKAFNIYTISTIYKTINPQNINTL